VLSFLNLHFFLDLSFEIPCFWTVEVFLFFSFGPLGSGTPACLVPVCAKFFLMPGGSCLAECFFHLVDDPVVDFFFFFL